MRAAAATTAVLVLALVAGVPAAQGAPEPDCSEVAYNATDPYEVWNAEQLQCMEPDTDYGLQSDINLSETRFKPIPVWNRSLNSTVYAELEEFTGSFEGNGHNITGLRIHEPREKNVGLFERIGPGASVSNVNLRGVNVTGDENVGGLAGEVDPNGEVTGVTVEGTVTGNSTVGGLVGKNQGSITDSVARVTVSGDESGELVGVNYGSISTAGGRTESLVGRNEGRVNSRRGRSLSVFAAAVAVIALLLVVAAVVIVRRMRSREA